MDAERLERRIEALEWGLVRALSCLAEDHAATQGRLRSIEGDMRAILGRAGPINNDLVEELKQRMAPIIAKARADGEM